MVSNKDIFFVFVHPYFASRYFDWSQSVFDCLLWRRLVSSNCEWRLRHVGCFDDYFGVYVCTNDDVFVHLLDAMTDSCDWLRLHELNTFS